MAQGYAKKDFADPGWQDWTPTWTNLTVGNGTEVARYIQIGTFVMARLELTFGSTTSVDSNFPRFTLPVSASSSGYTDNKTIIGHALLHEDGVNAYLGRVRIETSGTEGEVVELEQGASSGDVPNDAAVSSTSPFTWATNDKISVVLWYEAATSALINLGVNDDHGSLSGLSDDDHPQYLRSDAGDTYTGTYLQIQGHMSIGDSTDLTISSGAITATQGFHDIDPESGTTDDLDTINDSAGTGTILVLRNRSGTNTITAKDGTGNLLLAGDFVMDGAHDTLTLIKHGSNWLELSRGNNN